MINNQKSSKRSAVFNSFIRVMKLINLFLIVGICIVNATNSYSQSTLLSLDAKNNTLEEVFEMIEKNSEYVFFYSDKSVNLKQKVSIRIKDQTIDKILDQILRQTGNGYSIDDRQVFIGAKSEPSVPIVAQQKKITGKVIDEMGEALPGVAIQVKGTPRGVTTDIDGTFAIDVSSTDVLIFSYLGMKDQEVTVGNNKMLFVTLKENTGELEEVVVTAFGVGQKKESVVGSIVQVKPAELKIPSSNLSNSFAGRLAGVTSFQRTGEPGQDGASFYIRGISTINESAREPLIIIDGVEASKGDLNALDPEVIDGFSILKDATATAMYGTRGANVL